MKIKVVDTETSDLEPPEVGSGICELAWVDVESLESWTARFHPGVPITIGAMATHHITNEDIAGCPLYETYASVLDESFKDYTLAAHNAKYDSKFMKRQIDICTMQVARHIWPDMEKFGNQFLRYALGLPGLPRNAHAALDDALVTAAILREQIKHLGGGDVLEELKRLTAKPVLLRVCRFGNKHRDELWKDVPRSYLRWMERECLDLDADTLFTVRHYLNV